MSTKISKDVRRIIRLHHNILINDVLDSLEETEEELKSVKKEISKLKKQIKKYEK
jgi:hypothetical protein